MLSAYAWQIGIRREGHGAHQARGLCRKHYMRWKRSGSLERRMPRPSRRPDLASARPASQVLEEYAMIREDVESIADAAKRMGMSFSALDLALYRARQRGIRDALPPPTQMERALARGCRTNYEDLRRSA